MVENNKEFLSYGKLANILIGIVGVMFLTVLGWLKANIDANTTKVNALEIQQAQLAALQERVKTEELAQVALQAQLAASISQTAENTAMMKVYKEEIDNLYKVNAMREVRRNR